MPPEAPTDTAVSDVAADPGSSDSSVPDAPIADAGDDVVVASDAGTDAPMDAPMDAGDDAPASTAFHGSV